jgi:hypothetical protein
VVSRRGVVSGCGHSVHGDPCLAAVAEDLVAPVGLGRELRQDRDEGKRGNHRWAGSIRGAGFGPLILYRLTGIESLDSVSASRRFRLSEPQRY